jgi:hypothetical protein
VRELKKTKPGLAVFWHEHRGCTHRQIHIFFRCFLEKNRGKKYICAPTPPEDQAICLFAGLIVNPDMPLSLLKNASVQVRTTKVSRHFINFEGQ